METWSQLSKLSNGAPLDAETLNLPVTQLGQRTDYLFRQVRQLMAGGTRSSIVLTGVKVPSDPALAPEEGNVVYFDSESGEFRKAMASMSLYDDFTASESAFCVGILVRDGDARGVLVYGQMNLNVGHPIPKSSLLESGEAFRSGRYYLSASEPGKLTASPTGPVVYVGSFHSNGSDDADFTSASAAYVNPQFMDMGTSHVHRSHRMTARPVGSLSPDGSKVIGYLPIDPGTEASPSPSLAFGGSWTADGDIVYDFYLSEEAHSWGEVALHWRENGSSVENSVIIPAPGVFVDVSHGLKVKAFFPEATSSEAFSGLSEDRRKWAGLVFPGAGIGWSDHEARGTASDPADPADPTVLAEVWGAVSKGDSTVHVAFPGKVAAREFSESGLSDDFAYGGQVFRFVEDATAPASGYVPVQRGATLRESVASLARAVNREAFGGAVKSVAFSPAFSSGSDSDPGSDPGSDPDSASLVVMDGATDAWAGNVAADGGGFDVIGGTVPILVAYDDDLETVGTEPYLLDVPPYSDVDLGGRMHVTVYQGSQTTPVSVPFGTDLSCRLFDCEPGASYDYSVGMDQELNTYWPPVPAKSAALIVNGVEMENGGLFPDAPAVSFSASSVHWFESARSLRPWPDAFTSRDVPVEPALDKEMALHWVRGFQGATGPVTSLSVKPGSPLKIQRYGTEADAGTGDLWIGADIDFAVEGAGWPGYNAVKAGRHGRLLAGAVVERLRAGPGIVLSTKPGCPKGQGTVTVALDDSTFRGAFEISHENSKQQKLGMFTYVQLPGYASRLSDVYAFTGMAQVPTGLPARNYVMRIHATVFGEASFTNETAVKNAGLEMEYSILPDFTSTYETLKSGLLVPDVARSVNVPFGHRNGQHYEYDATNPFLLTCAGSGLAVADDVVTEALGAPLPSADDFFRQGLSPSLRPGYFVAVRFRRTVNTSGAAYTGNIGFLGLNWTISEQ